MKTQILIISIFFSYFFSIASVPGFYISDENNKTQYVVNSLKTKLVWTGKKVIGMHTGNIIVSKGTMYVENNKIVSGDFDIDMKTITDTDLEDPKTNASLVGHLKSEDFFNIGKYPIANLKIKNVIQKGEKFLIKADLTIKGITKPLEFEANIKISENNIIASSTILVDRTKYDIKYGSGKFFEGLGDKIIYDEFELKINLYAEKK
ncbi:MAG: hypothetical protein A2X12_12040 [Bacteroidetes bacterium GWE2_29_8]|nr:MAG: hypothetical protein A2X12_12040 [Bacteroidetes bacterium GWE2_29_8]OFY23955.1 MAG: hypothetical protein A2X02_00900 [Bacteroidetes bacterium GWF2_29_10]